jgi:hypothetical protein
LARTVRFEWDALDAWFEEDEHVIRWIDVHPDYSTRSEPAAVVAALDTADPPPST